MSVRFYFVFLLLITSYQLKAQQELPNAYHPICFGIEQDILPYFLKGFTLSGWAGMQHTRLRYNYAQANTPSFWKRDGILKERITASTLSVDFFLKDNFKGFWAGSAFGYWQTAIETKQGDKIAFPGIVFSVGAGYNWYFFKGFYLSPYFAGHLRISGTRNIELGTLQYRPSLMFPELSLKLGCRF